MNTPPAEFDSRRELGVDQFLHPGLKPAKSSRRITQAPKEGHRFFSREGVGSGGQHGQRTTEVLDFVVSVEVHQGNVANICSRVEIETTASAARR